MRHSSNYISEDGVEVIPTGRRLPNMDIHGDDRRPFVYDPVTLKLMVGPKGSYHRQLTGWKNAEQGNKWIGAWWPKDNAADIYKQYCEHTPEELEQHARFIKNALKVDEIRGGTKPGMLGEDLAAPGVNDEKWNFGKVAMAITPDQLQEWIAKHPYAYHRTEQGPQTVQKILREGLIPDPEYLNTGQAGSAPGHVYLITDDGRWGVPRKTPWAQLRVDISKLDPSRINFDADWAPEELGSSWLRHENVNFQDSPWNEPNKVEDSYKRGSIAYNGRIPPEALEINPEYTEPDWSRTGTVKLYPPEWECPECEGLGCERCGGTGEWNPHPTELMEEEPSFSYKDHGVQFGNDSPGVATIGA